MKTLKSALLFGLGIAFSLHGSHLCAQSTDQILDYSAIAPLSAGRANLVPLGGNWAYLDPVGLGAATAQIFSASNGRKLQQVIREVTPARYAAFFTVAYDGFGEAMLLRRNFAPLFFPAPPGPALTQYFRPDDIASAPFAEFRGLTGNLVLTDGSCVRLELERVLRLAAPCTSNVSLWQTNVDVANVRAQLVTEQTLVLFSQPSEVGTGQFLLTALDLANGQLKYQVPFSATNNYGDLYAGASLILLAKYDGNSGELLAFNKSNGNLLWRRTDLRANRLLARTEADMVVTLADAVCSLATTDGSTKWCVPAQSANLLWHNQSTVVFAELTNTPTVRAVDRINGQLRWQLQSNNRIALIGEELTEQIWPSAPNSPLVVRVLNPNDGTLLRKVDLDIRVNQPNALSVERIQRDNQTLSDLWVNKYSFAQQQSRQIKNGAVQPTLSDAQASGNDFVDVAFARNEARSYRERLSWNAHDFDFFDASTGKIKFTLNFNSNTQIGVTELGDIVSQSEQSTNGRYTIRLHKGDTGAPQVTWTDRDPTVFTADGTVAAWPCGNDDVCVLFHSQQSVRALQLRTGQILWERDLGFVGVEITPWQFHRVQAPERIALRKYDASNNLVVLDSKTGATLYEIIDAAERSWPMDGTRILELSGSAISVRDLVNGTRLARHEINAGQKLMALDFNSQNLALGLARLHNRLTAPVGTGVAGAGEYFSSVRFLSIPELSPINETIVARTSKSDFAPQALIYHVSMENNGQAQVVHGFGNTQTLRSYAYKNMTPRSLTDNLRLTVPVRNTMAIRNQGARSATISLAAGSLRQIQNCTIEVTIGGTAESTNSTCPTQLPGLLSLGAGHVIYLTMTNNISEAHAYAIDWQQETSLIDNSYFGALDFIHADGFE